MVNLFRHLQGEPGDLTAGLLAVLEHADRSVFHGLLRLAGVPAQLEEAPILSAQFPLPGGPANAGAIAAPPLHWVVATQGPGEPFQADLLQHLGEQVLAITLTGQESPGIHTLSWDQVDRWLLEVADRYDPETRTGFLLRQFRELLADLGLEHFAGFRSRDLAQVPDALAALSSFSETAGRFFQHLSPAVAALWEGVSPVRESRAEDLLAGYLYRDYAGGPFGPAGFLRVAIHVGQQETQISFWLAPGAGDSHSRLREALAGGGSLLEQLRDLGREPTLWLWSPDGEQRIPLERLTTGLLAELDWGRYQVGLQRQQPVDWLAGEGAVQRVVRLAEELVQVLDPVLTPVLH